MPGDFPVSQPHETLREKLVEAIEQLQTTKYGNDANLIAGDSLVTLRRHFDSRRARSKQVITLAFSAAGHVVTPETKKIIDRALDELDAIVFA